MKFKNNDCSAIRHPYLNYHKYLAMFYDKKYVIIKNAIFRFINADK